MQFHSLYILDPDGCLVRIMIRHLNIVKNRSRKGIMGMSRAGVMVSLHNNRLRENYVLVDRSLLMGASIESLSFLLKKYTLDSNIIT